MWPATDRSMNLGPRSFGSALAIFVLLLAAIWVGDNTWRDLRQLRGSFVFMQADDLSTSEYIESSIRDLDEMVLRIDLRHDQAEQAAFQKLSREVEQCIREHRYTFTLPEQRQMMGRIEPALMAHLSFMTNLMDEGTQVGALHSSKTHLEQVEGSAAPVLELCRKLKASELAEQAQFMQKSQRALEGTRNLLIAVLAALIALVGAALVAIYRGVIGPLRAEVSQSRALAARNEKLASLGTLAAGVAHEIRNPLTAINVRLHSLKKGLAPNSSEQEDALVIGHEIERLEYLIKEFLQFARPSEPKLVTVSADSLLAKAQSLLGAKLEKNSIQLNLQSVPDIWVQADPQQFEQVLINLIQNAAESMESGGIITVRALTGKRRLAGSSRPAVILEVSDTGKGIPPEVQKRMFDPFFTTKEAGTGLGLAIALRIIEKHGGALEFASDLNRGTTFTILLPQTTPQESSQERHELSPQDSVD
jgi:signal transduction histidine kinase